jgi:hypothetical protein
MKKFSVLATTYTAKQLGDIDIKAFRSKTAYRYRQDIFPNPDGFGVKILAVAPEIIENNDGIYTHRLKLTVFFPEDSDDKKLERYKAAIELKTKRFDIVRSNESKKPKAQPVKEQPAPVVEEPVEERPAEQPAEAPAQEQPAAEQPSEEQPQEAPAEQTDAVVESKPKKSKKK